MRIKDRITELRRVKAADLRPNPKNWRTLPKQQADALQGILSEIGYADALIARELPDGSLMLIDGHLRAETTPDAEVPVLVTDLTEAEADLLLASLDPLAALATTDNEKLDELLADLSPQSEALKEMPAGMKGPELDLDYQPDESETKGLRQLVVALSPEQYEDVVAVLDQLVSEGHGADPTNPNEKGNALHYGLCTRK